MSRLIAASIGAPVVERVRNGGTSIVLGSGPSAAYMDFGGFIVTVTGPGVPLMPNGISLAAARPVRLQRGANAVWRAGGLQFGEAFIDCTRATTGRTLATINARAPAGRVADRAPHLLRWAHTLTLDEMMVGALGEALMMRDPTRIEAAARTILGRGPGLTPEGDDLLTGCVAGLVAFARPAGLATSERDLLLARLGPPDAKSRTTSLSATLLALASIGHVAEPLVDVLDLDVAPERFLEATRSLETIGHSTGRAWMTGCGITASCLASNALVAGPIWM